MDAVTIRFDETLRVSQHGGWGYRNYFPRATTFSFMAAGKYFPYVTTPGWPEIHDGLTVTALLEAPGDWKSLLGWINRETGEVCGPSPAEYLKQASVVAVQLCLGVFMFVAGWRESNVFILFGALFSAFCLYHLYASFRDWSKAKTTLAALDELGEGRNET